MTAMAIWLIALMPGAKSARTTSPATGPKCSGGQAIPESLGLGQGDLVRFDEAR